MTTLTVWIPGAYVGKNRRHDGVIKTKRDESGRARQYATKRLTKEAAEWLKGASWAIAAAALEQCWQTPPGDLRAVIRHSNGRFDVDAPVPLVLDAIQLGLGFNDHQFTELVVQRVPPAQLGGEGVWVEVRER